MIIAFNNKEKWALLLAKVETTAFQFFSKDLHMWFYKYIYLKQQQQKQNTEDVYQW